MEEIFERIEVEVVNPTVSNIQDWLSGKGTAHPKRRYGYRNFAIQLQEPLNIIERAEETSNIDELWDLEQEADEVEISRTKVLRVVRERMEVASREVELPRAPTQREIKRIAEWSPLFAPMIEEIADEKFGISVTNVDEWDALPGNQRGTISREIGRRLRGI